MNHQLIQSDKPSTTNGFVEFGLNSVLSRARITRAHLEEEVGNNTHVGRHGGVSDCDRERGMVRWGVNVCMRPVGSKEIGAKIEIRSMNSLSGVCRALTPRLATMPGPSEKQFPISSSVGNRTPFHDPTTLAPPRPSTSWTSTGWPARPGVQLRGRPAAPARLDVASTREYDYRRPLVPQELWGVDGTKHDLIAVVDLDNDGDSDVITTEEQGGLRRNGLGVIWYENPRK